MAGCRVSQLEGSNAGQSSLNTKSSRGLNYGKPAGVEGLMCKFCGKIHDFLELRVLKNAI